MVSSREGGCASAVRTLVFACVRCIQTQTNMRTTSYHFLTKQRHLARISQITKWIEAPPTSALPWRVGQGQPQPPKQHRAFFANKDVLYDRNIPLAQRLRFFDAMVIPVACFAVALQGTVLCIKGTCIAWMWLSVNICASLLGHPQTFSGMLRGMKSYMNGMLVRWSTGRVQAVHPGPKTVCSNIGSLLCMLVISRMNAG